jgi:hypothetical protein
MTLIITKNYGIIIIEKEKKGVLSNVFDPGQGFTIDR